MNQACRTYYIRPDGSATPNRPWTDSQVVMTLRSRSVKEAEAGLHYLEPRDIYARIEPQGSGSTIILCSTWALRNAGMNNQMFFRRDRHGVYETQVIGIDLEDLVPMVMRIANEFTHRKRASPHVKLFDGSAISALYWDERAGEMRGGDPVGEVDLKHRDRMHEACGELDRALEGEGLHEMTVRVGAWER